MVKISLIILDGWGYSKKKNGNAVFQAHTSTFDFLCSKCDVALLKTDGPSVGLPEGAMGNSEIGHTTIGAGRICPQSLQRINQVFFENFSENSPQIQKIIQFIQKIKERGGKLHLAGLFSKGGVHSHQDHLCKIAQIADKLNLPAWLHIFADGRDTAPRNIQESLQELQLTHNTRIATLIGRYFAMDRDHNWSRTKVAYDLLIQGRGDKFSDIHSTINEFYAQDITDEFFPAACHQDYSGFNLQKDGLIFCNFRADRARQLFSALYNPNFDHFKRPTKIDLALSMFDYENDFAAECIFNKPSIAHTLGEILSENGLKQARIAETEKFNHITYFFNGFRKISFAGEQRFLLPSPKVKTFDMQPEMSASQITQSFIDNFSKFDFFLLNFANPDMVGHTGNFDACIQAIECVDRCLGKILQCVKNDPDHFLIVTADHGNAEEMGDPQFLTCHSLNPVPFLIYNKNKKLNLKKTSDLTQIAPTILQLFGLPIPRCMNQETLLK